MKNNTESNAITQRLDLLRAAYSTFHKDKAALLCLWLPQLDEVQMIDAFVQYENSEVGITPDFFLTFSSPFLNAKSYGQHLLAEVHQYFGKNGELLREAALPDDIKIPQNAETPFAVFQPLSEFARKAQPLLYVVAYLKPSEVSDFAQWEQWIADALQQGLAPQVRLMLAVPEQYYPFYALRKAYKSQVKNLVPDLNMPDALRQLASTGNLQDPAVQFRLLFLEMGQAAGAKDFERLNTAAEKALALTQEQGWDQMEFTVRTAYGAHLQPHKHLQKAALDEYVKGRQIADRMVQQGHPLGGQIFLQSRLFYGAGLLNAGQYPEAAQEYEAAAAKIAGDEQQRFQYMETCRLAGQSHMLAGNHEKAWSYYLNALDAAELLDAEQRYNTLLLYVAAALIRLIPKANQERKETEIRDRIARLIGPDWESQMKNQKISA
ncbi:MAG: hypothetical protein J0L99_09705 [Chitinophagales bacterium]|nr:hypothetical protein [Chitinophagales bacterium]